MPARTLNARPEDETKGPSLERRSLRRVAGDSRFNGLLGRGVAMVYLSLIVMIPLAALVTNAFDGGLGSFWKAITQTEAIDAIRLTLICSLSAALLNAVAGTATAWILVRDRFWGQGVLNAVIDLPFALPTVVAGVTFYTLYGPLSPVHANVTGSWIGITIAIVFVTLPFTVRSVQPVLESLTFNAEAAAATLGASSARVFRTITLPTLMPSILTGTGLAFARALGEYGSVVFISNNLPYRSEVASSYIYSLSTSGQTNAAASVAVLLLILALVVLGIFNLTSTAMARKRA